MIEIILDKGSYWPKDEIGAKIVLEFSKPVKARGLYTKLVCTEKKRTETLRHMDTHDYRVESELGVPRSSHMKKEVREEKRIIFEKEEMLCGEQEYSGGEYDVKFVLPPNARPTSTEYGHDNLIHLWKIKVRLDIPWALDKNAEKAVFVEGL